MRYSIKEAYTKLDEDTRDIIDEKIEVITSMCAGDQVGRAAALELLAKLGMFLSK